MSALVTSIRHSCGSPRHGNQKTKREKGIQIGKEKLSLSADGVIVYIEDPKDATRKVLVLINGFSKVSGYKINTQKYFAFLYTSNKKSERKIKEATPLITATKKNKIPGINLPRETKEQYAENYKTLMKKSKITQTDGEIYHVLGLEESVQ